MESPIKRALTATIATLVVTGLAGCAPQGPTVMATPKVVVERPASSPLENDPYVKAARASDLGYVMAVNSHDFTIAQFNDTSTKTWVTDLWYRFDSEQVGEKKSPMVFPGPLIWVPVSVTVNAEGDGATVLLCDASGDWVSDQYHSKPSYDLSDGVLSTYSIVTENGLLKMARVDSAGPSPCDASGAPVGRFDPAPVLPESIAEQDARAPLFVKRR